MDLVLDLNWMVPKIQYLVLGFGLDALGLNIEYKMLDFGTARICGIWIGIDIGACCFVLENYCIGYTDRYWTHACIYRRKGDNL